MAKPISSKMEWPLMNPILSQVLNPIIASPTNQIQIISDYNFVTGANILDHKLGRMMQGWFVIDPQGAQTLYRSAPLNSLTLTLTSSGTFTSSIGVF